MQKMFIFNLGRSMFTDGEKKLIALYGGLVFTNPFTEARTKIEKNILGRKYRTLYNAWHSVDGELSVNENLTLINSLCSQLIERGLSGCIYKESADFIEHWDIFAIYWLFARYSGPMCRNIYLGEAAENENASLYADFLADFSRVIYFSGRSSACRYLPENIFALFHQIHRAFNHIFDFIAGGSPAASRMRSSIWESIFTCDLRRYSRHLLYGMEGITTLVCGESGTGKELAARAIAFSQFIPFNAGSGRFEENYRNCYHPVQLSAMPQTLVESELFGHARGAFTGAISTVRGHFETCRRSGCIFLDEIGDVSMETQAKLLRLLQTRQFNRVGETEQRAFSGKVIAATNKNLPKLCSEGAFRHDLLFRICSDTVNTAPLRELIDGREEELRQFVIILAKRMLEGDEALDFASACCDWIIGNLGLNYDWPGNVRELEQCLRNLLVRGEYRPVMSMERTEKNQPAYFFENCRLTADELMREYIGALYRREGTLAAVAAISGLDRRTVKKYLS